MDNTKKIIFILLIVISTTLAIDTINIKNAKKELYEVASVVNKDIIKYSTLREEMVFELKDNYKIDLTVIKNESNILTYKMSRKLDFSITTLSSNDIYIIQRVWTGFL